MKSRVAEGQRPEVAAAAPGLATNTAWALGSELAQLLFGLGVFFATARALGDEQFGQMMGVLALALITSSLAQLGAQQILMLDHAAGGSFRDGWGRALTTVIGGGVAVLALALPFRTLLAPDVGLAAFGLVFASQAIGFAVTDYCVIATQAHRRLRSAFFIRAGSGLVRASAAVAFLFAGGDLLDDWAWIVAATWTIVAVGAVMYVNRTFDVRRPPVGLTVDDARRGLPYSMNAASAMFLDSSDRVMLSAYGFAGPAGVYSAGARMATLATLPLMALVRASDFDMYDRGRSGIGAARKLALRLASMAVVYGVLAGAGIYVLAWVPELLLGDTFDGTTEVIRWLAVIPLLQGLRVMGGNVLTTVGRQGLRNAAIVFACVLNFAGNVWLIPIYDWRGAAVSTLVAEAVLVVIIWAMIQTLSRRGQDADERR